MEKTPERHHPPDDSAPWLVLGAAGFIGRAVFTHLRAQGQKVIGIDVKNPGSIKTGDGSWFTLNIHEPCLLQEIVRKIKPSVLLNAIGHDSASGIPALCDEYICSTTHILQAVQIEQPNCRVILIVCAD